MAEEVGLFECTSPCPNCPYRLDAPLQHWSVEEFKRVLDVDYGHDDGQLGVVFYCHKKNGSVCIGWLMNQVERGLPSVKLRVYLRIHDMPESYLDELSCEVGRFETVEEMCVLNFPHLKYYRRRRHETNF